MKSAAVPAASTRFCYETNNYSPALTAFFARPLLRPPTLIEQLDAAAVAGYEMVGLDLGSIGHFLAGGERLEALRDLLAARGLACLHVANLSIGDDREVVEKEATSLEAVIATLSPCFLQCSVQAQRAGPEVMAVFRELEARVAPYGCELAIEFLPFSILNSIQATRDFIDSARLERARVLVDNWHFCKGGEAWRELEDLENKEIAYIQFSDHPGRPSQALLDETVNRRCLPGEGSLPLRQFCDAVMRKGYQGAVSLEVLSDAWRQSPPEAFAAAELDASRPYWL